ncbi:hypothetical protein MKX01_010616 [Papaver californicum]|nr:hypothetical protein MKX01_010616 [Papaver californicum]
MGDEKDEENHGKAEVTETDDSIPVAPTDEAKAKSLSEMRDVKKDNPSQGKTTGPDGLHPEHNSKGVKNDNEEGAGTGIPKEKEKTNSTELHPWVKRALETICSFISTRFGGRLEGSRFLCMPFQEKKIGFGVLFVIAVVLLIPLSSIYKTILDHKSDDPVTQLFFSTLGMIFAVSKKDPVTQLVLSTLDMNSAVSKKDPVTQLSWNPRAFLREDFLTDKECDHLINLAKSAKSNRHNIPKAQDPVVSGIEDRIAKWTFLPTEYGEPMKVVRYQTWHEEQPERDYSFITVLMYLNDVKSGGETVLLQDATKQGHDIKHDLHVECAKKGIPVIPRKGTALLLFNLNASVLQDAFSIRRDCPVQEGEKWTAVKLIHVDSFNNDCLDMNDQCIGWAKEGECTLNTGYMLKACRKSCKEC